MEVRPCGSRHRGRRPVTWDLTDAQISHSATADDKSFDSGLIAPGNKWTHTFDKPGEYRYHCEPHPWKKGVIRVK